ncbi:hypothetical protein ACVDG5_010920 [Mesorhizobium sp. ORM6]
MRDNIFDGETGEHVAFIKDGRVHRVKDGLEIGHIRDGNMYTPNGKFVGGLQSLEQPDAGRPLSAEFKTLLAK